MQAYGVNPSVDGLIQEVKALRRRLDAAPMFRWAVVTSTSPLRIRLEEDTLPLLGSPSTLVGGHAVGDRVRVELQNGRATIHGRGTGPAPTPRKIAGGSVSTNPVANTPTQTTVTFPVGVFTSSPFVTATAQSTVVGTTVLGVGVTSRSVSSVNIVITRTNNTATSVNWIAVQD